jgi:hypothetical protein
MPMPANSAKPVHLDRPRFGLISSPRPSDPVHLFVLLKDLRRIILAG